MANPVILADNRLEDAAVTLAADSELSSIYAIENLADRRPYTYWMASVSGSIAISITSCVASFADAIGVLGHNLGTTSASFFLDLSPDNGATWSEMLSYFPSTDGAFLLTFASHDATACRMRIVTSHAGAAPSYMSYVAIGVKISMPQPPDAPTIPYTKSVVSASSVSKAGWMIGTDIAYKAININHRFSLLDRTWVTSTFEAFWDDYLSENKPFFYLWDSALYPALVFFVWRKEDATFAWPVSLLPYVDSIELNLEGVLE